MAQFSQFGRPKLCSTGTPAISIADVVDLEISLGAEMNDHFGGTNRQPRYSIGNDATKITLTTTDTAALGWVKGMQCTTLTCQFEGTATSVSAAGAVSKGTANTVGIIVSNVRVAEAVEIKSSSDGKPGEIKVVFEPAIVETTGAEPTITYDTTFSS